MRNLALDSSDIFDTVLGVPTYFLVVAKYLCLGVLLHSLFPPFFESD